MYPSQQFVCVRSLADVDFGGVSGIVSDVENSIAPLGAHSLTGATLRDFQRAFNCGVRFVVLMTNKRLGPERRDGRRRRGDFSIMVNQIEAEAGAMGFVVRASVLQPGGQHSIPRKPNPEAFGLAEMRLVSMGWHGTSRNIMMIGDKWHYDIAPAINRDWRTVLVNPIGPDGWRDHVALTRWRERREMSALGVTRAGLEAA